MKALALSYLIFLSLTSVAQLPLSEDEFFSRLAPGTQLSENLLRTRTAVFHDYTVSMQEMELLQDYFERIGIDAVIYYEMDYLMAGRDVSMSMAQYLMSREIANLVLVRKSTSGYEVSITNFNRKANFVDENQPCWRDQNRLLEEILKSLSRASSYGLKRENFLVNEFVENGTGINPIAGRRGEFFAVDLKVDALAVPKFGDEEKDKQLAELMQSYPFKYTLTDPNLSEAELRKQGLLFVLRFVHARAKIAKSSLGYDMAKAESAIVSISFQEDQAVLKNIPANEQVYKFYFKHIDSGNVYLGTKWDADTNWYDALANQIKGFKKELKIN